MQDMLDEEDEQSGEIYARVAREQASDEERLLGVSRVLSPSASWTEMWVEPFICML